jgi:hypothetical protein
MNRLKGKLNFSRRCGLEASRALVSRRPLEIVLIMKVRDFGSLGRFGRGLEA